MKPAFCWVCGRRFWGNKVYYIVAESGFVKWVHKQCAIKYGYQLIPEEEAKRRVESEGNKNLVV